MFAFTSGSFVNRPRVRGLKVDEIGREVDGRDGAATDSAGLHSSVRIEATRIPTGTVHRPRSWSVTPQDKPADGDFPVFMAISPRTGDWGFGTGDQTTKAGHGTAPNSTEGTPTRASFEGKPAIPPPATWDREEPTKSTQAPVGSPPASRTSDRERGRSFRTERRECTRRANRAGWSEKSERGYFSVGNRFPARWRQDGLTRMRITERVRRPDLLRWQRSETRDSQGKTPFSPEQGGPLTAVVHRGGASR